MLVRGVMRLDRQQESKCLYDWRQELPPCRPAAELVWKRFETCSVQTFHGFYTLAVNNLTTANVRQIQTS